MDFDALWESLVALIKRVFIIISRWVDDQGKEDENPDGE